MKIKPWTHILLWQKVQRHRDYATGALRATIHHSHPYWLPMMQADHVALRHLKAAEALLTRAKVTA